MLINDFEKERLVQFFYTYLLIWIYLRSLTFNFSDPSHEFHYHSRGKEVWSFTKFAKNIN